MSQIRAAGSLPKDAVIIYEWLDSPMSDHRWGRVLANASSLVILESELGGTICLATDFNLLIHRLWVPDCENMPRWGKPDLITVI